MLRFALALAALALRPALAADTAPEPPVAPDGGYTVQLCAECKFPRVAHLALSGKKAFLVKEEPKVVEAAIGSERSEALASAFTPEWICAAGKKLPCDVQGMKLTVDDTIHRAGTYNLVISLQPASQPQLPRWKLMVVQAAATLEVQTIAITRYRYWPQDETPPLEMRNSSDSSRLTLTVAGQWDAFSDKGRIVITTTPPPDIHPKHNATLDYKLEGDFPTGKVTHTLRFDGPQLTAPVTVNVDVETKWIGLYLWFAVLAGLGIGYYVKVVLRDRIALAQARIQADDLISEAQGDRDRIQDADFRGAVDGPLQQLRDARNGSDAAEIQRRHDTLANALKEATVENGTNLQNARKSLESLRAVVNTDWKLPASITAALTTARNALPGVETMLGDFNAHGASARVTTLRNDFVTAIRPVLEQWPTVRQTLVRLSQANAGIPARVATQMAAEMRDPPKDWQTLRALPIEPADADISAVLSDYEPKFAFVNGVLLSLADRMEREWIEITGRLNPIRAHLAHPEALAPLDTQWNDLLTQLRRGGQDAAGAVDITNERLGNLQQAWLNGYTAQVAPPDAAAIVLQINARDFAAATITLVRLVATAAGVALGPAAGAPPQWQATPAPTLAGGSPTPATSAQATPWFPFIRRFQPSPTDVIRKSQLIQSAVVLLIMTVSLSLGALTSNEGTWADLFHAFSMAFAADVTLDALMARLKT